MKRQLLLLFLPLFFVVFFLGFPTLAHASTVTLSGSVKDSSGNAIGGATVSVNDTNNDSTTTDPTTGDYSLSIPSGTYNIQVTPPSGSNYSSAIAMAQNISSDTILNFSLVPVGSVTLSGHLYDGSGNPISNMLVSLSGSNGNASVRTGSDGSYSLKVNNGTYTFNIGASGSQTGYPAGYPDWFWVRELNYSLTQSVILNLTLPVEQVTIHAQDPSGNPLGGVKLTDSNDGLASNQDASIGGGITNATLQTKYSVSSTAPVTDATTGNATVYLFPDDSNGSYKFIATPPSGSGVVTTSVPTFTVSSTTSNPTQTVNMQQAITLSGHLYDENGNPITNMLIGLSGSNGFNTSIRTDSSGSYSLQAASGTYTLTMGALGSQSGYPAGYPDWFWVRELNYSLTQNTNLDLTLPVRKIIMHVQDSFGNPVGGVKLTDPNDAVSSNQDASIGGGITNASLQTKYSVSSTAPITDATTGNATLYLFPDDANGSYTFTATPPTGSNYITTTIPKFTVTNDDNKTATINSVSYTLNGQLHDGSNTPISNMIVSLSNSSGFNTSTRTDSNGNYSLQAAGGNYTLSVGAQGPQTGYPAGYPDWFYVQESNYALSQNTTLNLTLPLKTVTVHVQDPLGNPVGGVTLTDTNDSLTSNQDASIGGGITNASLWSKYYTASSAPQTDPTTGNATLLLFPNDSNSSYNFTATPPSGSNYSSFGFNFTVTNNETELVALQYNHATPVTTATLSTPFSDGLSPDPTTVTLNASAAAGYTIANTYYTIDGGAQQTYSTPFTVTGAGSHTITYWSVDNSGVPESANTKTFTITEAYNLTGTVYNDANQNGFQDTGEQGVSGVTVSLNTGQTATTDSNGNYTFSNLESGTYTETVTVPNGYTATTSNPVSVPLSANTTENFGIAQLQASPVVAINAGGDTQGNYSADTDYSGGTTYTSSDTVDTSSVTNPAPEAVYQSVRYGNTFSYTIPNLTANGSYTVRLHFNELYWNAAGQRVFNVGINGTQVLSNFDIYQTAGGKNKAITEQFPATADSNGNITINFSTVTDNAMVNGIEVYSGTLPSPTPTPTPTPVSSLAISAGGTGSGSYVADTDYTGGTTYNTSATIDTTGVTNPAPQSVYQNVRYGNTFSYTIPTYNPNANYTVRLDFAEPYWNAEGQREFNVAINGTQVLNNFDVYQQAGGENKAISETFNTTTDSNGHITIQFSTVTDNAMISGIQISQQ